MIFYRVFLLRNKHNSNHTMYHRVIVLVDTPKISINQLIMVRQININQRYNICKRT
jgi:hypothetical protein